MSEKKRAQIAMEYLLLTAFILVAVAIIFAFSFLNYGQNIRVAKANEAMAKMANAVDDVYTRGERNNRFVNISFPDGMTDLSVLHKCIEESTSIQGTLNDCEQGCSASGYDCVQFSAISMTVQLIGGESVILRETRAKILADPNGDIPNTDMSDMDSSGIFNKYAGSGYSVKVSWTNDKEKIQLLKA